MKFKQQEESSKNNPFIESVANLIKICIQFEYAIKSQIDFVENKYEISKYYDHVNEDLAKLTKLYISLNPTHKRPGLLVELIPVDSIKDLKDFEEKYYNMLKEIGKNALEAGEFEVISYLSELIKNFEHYFCILDEDDDSRETSS